MNILIINSCADDSDKLASCIKNEFPGSSVFVFSSAAEAGKFFLCKRIDVIFTEPVTENEKAEEFLVNFKKINPRLNIIITSSGSDFMEKAFLLHVSGYMIRPYDQNKVSEQLNNLLYPSEIEIITFGNFGVFVNGHPVSFRRSKSCEALAFIVDRRSPCTRKQIAACIFEDRSYDRSCQKYTDNILRDMVSDLEKAGAGELLIHSSNSYSINRSVCVCDYYEYLEGNRKIFRNDEYMSQYSWAEVTLASLG